VRCGSGGGRRGAGGQDRPKQSTGYYHEYTVTTPGSSTRGARRIVTGQQYEEDYCTADHYASFDLIDHDC
jgi:ribonuclease T1